MAVDRNNTSDEQSEALADDEALAPEHQALAEELAACIAAYDEYMLADDESDAPMPLEQVEHDAAVARRLLSVLRETPALWGAFDVRADGILEEWMNGLPFDLVEHQRMDDAVLLATEIDEVCGSWIEGTATAKAAILIRAGRESEARALLEAALAASPDDCVVLEDAAELFEELGEPERAKTLLEKLVALDVHPFNENARERLGLGPKPPATPVPFVSASPKVGRNDPCPCGSGKKFKKCCG